MAHVNEGVVLGLLLVASVSSKAVKEIKEVSYGMAKPCDPKTNDVRLTWSPKEFKLGDAVRFSANWTLNADFYVGYGSFKWFNRATKNSYETETGYTKCVTCKELLAVLITPDIRTNIKSNQRCPIKKGETIQLTYTSESFSTVPFTQGRKLPPMKEEAVVWGPPRPPEAMDFSRKQIQLSCKS